MRIACVLANGFEDSEFRQPHDALKQAGHQVTIVGMEAGQWLKGDKGRETATVEKAFSEVSPDDFDAHRSPSSRLSSRKTSPSWRSVTVRSCSSPPARTRTVG